MQWLSKEARASLKDAQDKCESFNPVAHSGANIS